MSYIEIFDKVEKKIWSQSTKGVQGQPISNQIYPYNPQNVFGPSRFYLDKSVLDRNVLVLVSHTNRLMWVPGLLGPKPFRPGTPRPGRFGPFSIRDCSARFSGTARPIFFYFLFIFFWGVGAIYCFILSLCGSKQDSRNFIYRDINFQTRK